MVFTVKVLRVFPKFVNSHHQTKDAPMRYISTRGQAAPLSFCDILLGGLAPDGGLYLPEHYPQVSRADLDAWRILSYPDLAFKILSLFIDDIPTDTLKKIVAATYTADAYRFSRNPADAGQITPLVNLFDGISLLELSNGPTMAFKDIALRLLGNLFEYELGRRGEEMNILGATSGDTGSAAEYAMRGKKGIKVFMLSPHGKGMTAFQAAQMYSLHDANIFNIAVRGMFDDAQNVVKAVFGDALFKTRYKLGAVNSINWARVAAQIVYYFWGYFRATKGNDERVSFSVPTGNFGNICAGHVARMMGLPVDRLILATNENDVLDEFFRHGTYRPRSSREAMVTSSPSMDITKASNFERFMFDLLARDSGILRNLWSSIEAGGMFSIAETVYQQRLSSYGIVSGRSTDADRLSAISMVHRRCGMVIDPHTADGLKVALEYRNPGESMVVMETAQPTKFCGAIRKALGFEPRRPPELAGIEDLPMRVAVLEAEQHVIKAFIVSSLGA
jgi:threonine synthase